MVTARKIPAPREPKAGAGKTISAKAGPAALSALMHKKVTSSGTGKKKK